MKKKKEKYKTMLIHSVDVPFAGYNWASIIYCWWKAIAGLSCFIHVGEIFLAFIFSCNWNGVYHPTNIIDVLFQVTCCSSFMSLSMSKVSLWLILFFLIFYSF